jgi:hypothetical protein
MSDHGHRWPPEDERARALSDADLDAIDLLLDAKTLHELHEAESRIIRRLDKIMATLAEAAAVDAELQATLDQVTANDAAQDALILQLQGQIGSGNLPPDQQAIVDNLFTQLSAQRDQAKATLNPAAPPAPFVAKIAGETFSDYTARVAAWNADPANSANQVTALDSAAWDALPPVTTTTV